MFKDFVIIDALYQIGISSENNTLALEFKNNVLIWYTPYIFNALL